MKQTIFVLSIAVLLIGGIAIYQTTEKNQIKADFETFKNTVDISIQKRINDEKRHVTDSLTTLFESLPPDTVIKNQIDIRYERITDTIIIRSYPEQLEYITDELNRLYPSN